MKEDVHECSGISAGSDAPSDALVIDADGRTRTPGFIDAHAHVMLQPTLADAANTDLAPQALYGASMAKLYLSRGYTTIRDTGGNTFSLKKAIDAGITEGPRDVAESAGQRLRAGPAGARAGDEEEVRPGSWGGWTRFRAGEEERVRPYRFRIGHHQRAGHTRANQRGIRAPDQVVRPGRDPAPGHRQL